MNRKLFLKLSLLPILGTHMKLSKFSDMTQSFGSSEEMPILFIGHGNPMNAIEENEFSKTWQELGKTLPKPTAILCISAHWETKGTFVTAMPKPPTIHDFGGFPQSLFDVQYAAPGDPALAEETQKHIVGTEVGLDYTWGLDHGCWSVLKHLYPEADVPVMEFSIDYTKGPEYHYNLAKELAFLRKKGVLIIGSGNMVHNLRLVAWDKMNVPNFGFDWAIEAHEQMKKYISENNHKELINYKTLGKAFDLAIPTPEHYIPLLYMLGLKKESENIHFFNDKLLMGSLNMTSVKIG